MTITSELRTLFAVVLLLTCADARAECGQPIAAEQVTDEIDAALRAYGSRSLAAKLKVSWRYWAREPNWAFKLAPVFLGFAVPGKPEAENTMTIRWSNHDGTASIALFGTPPSGESTNYVRVKGSAKPK